MDIIHLLVCLSHGSLVQGKGLYLMVCVSLDLNRAWHIICAYKVLARWMCLAALIKQKASWPLVYCGLSLIIISSPYAEALWPLSLGRCFSIFGAWERPVIANWACFCTCYHLRLSFFHRPMYFHFLHSASWNSHIFDSPTLASFTPVRCWKI